MRLQILTKYMYLKIIFVPSSKKLAQQFILVFIDKLLIFEQVKMKQRNLLEN